MYRLLILVVPLLVACSDRTPVPTAPRAGKAADFESMWDVFRETSDDQDDQQDTEQTNEQQDESPTQPPEQTPKTQEGVEPVSPVDLGGSVEDDRAALEAVYQALMSHTDPPRGWLTRIRLAKWECVETNSVGRVTSLTLPCKDTQRRPSGILPPEIGQLTYLRHLEIKGVIWDRLPPEIGQLAQLEHLHIQASYELRGTLPDEWANLHKLRVLRIESSSIGTDPSLYDDPETDWLDPYHHIPAWLGQLSSLEVLDLYGTYFAGPIPAELGQLVNLKVFKGSGVPGPLPPELGQLSQLDTLSIIRIHSASIPPEWGGMTSLRVLFLDSPHPPEEGESWFGGRIPAELGNLTNLEELTLRGNFEGPLPSQLGQLEKLRQLRIWAPNYQEGQLYGPLPAEWSGMKNLEELYLFNHELEGMLPPEWAFMQSLRVLHLQNNFIEGPLPDIWGQMVNLETIDLSQNFIEQLSGAWGHMNQLRELNLEENDLTGPLPEEWRSLRNLEELNLSRNQLTGPIPQSWNGMVSLQRLRLEYNQLSGKLPDLRGLSKLGGMWLRGNDFTPDDPRGCFSEDLFPSKAKKYGVDGIGICSDRSDPPRPGSDYLLGG